MKKGTDKASELTGWGSSLLNKLASLSRKRRKRDASKRRRKSGKQAIEKQVGE